MSPAVILAVLLLGSLLFGIGMGASVALMHADMSGEPDEYEPGMAPRDVARLVGALGCGLLVVGILSVMGMSP